MRANNKYDFSGWATKNDLKCSDGRTIRKNAFIENDGKTVPLVWQHQHDAPENVLGHALLENRDEGVYAYCKFNSTPNGEHAKELVQHGDIKYLSIYANKLQQQGGNVLHGAIREVSLVLAGANPGAMIDFPILQHGDGTISESYDEAIIYTDEELYHADDEETEENTMNKEKTVKDIFETFTKDQKNLLYFLIAQAKSGKKPAKPAMAHADTEDEEGGNGPTVKEVFNSLNEEQKKVLYFLVGKATEGGSSEQENDEEMEHSDYYEDYEDDYDIEHSDEGGNYYMARNVFENEKYEDVLTHGDIEDIFANAKRSGSLKAAVESYADVIQHSISEIDNLFPDYKALMEKPELLQRQDEWVSKVWNGVHKTPFSRIKTVVADITAEEARAKGYIKGKQKLEEVITTLKRVTGPQTVYKLQKLNRDDVLDITDFDVVAFIKAEMRIMLNEELSRAILIGDGRTAGDDKINETNIRPIWKDDDFYTIKKDVTIPSNATNYDVCEALIEAGLRARNDYKGSGVPTAFVTPDTLTTMLLAKDTTGRRIYNSVNDLAAAWRVKEIVEVPVMENQKRKDSSQVEHKLLALIVNLSDYNVGADKGGNVNMFDDFDINYNKYEYLIETRCSGALVKPYAAIALETVVA